MNADRETLKAAVLKALPDQRAMVYLRHDRIADAIVDAVIAVGGEGLKEEWAYRYPNGHVATWIPELMTEDLARHMVTEYPDLLTAVRRRVTEWEDA